MTASNTQPKPLFSLGDAEDRAYSNLRDEVSETARACKQFSERLWAEYHAYADDQFLIEIRRDFSARFWEMYLTCTFLQDAPRLGYTVSCPKPGPDILIEHEGRRVWIEAIVATDGDPARPDSAVEDHSGKIPDEKIILRYANAIDAKHAKYVAYRKNDIVGTDDAYVIAINGYPLSYRWAEPEIPRVLKALFPLGAPQVFIDRGTGEIVGARHQFRPSVKKASGSVVPTDIFLNDSYCGISAVLHSCASGYSKPPMGVDFVIVHNPLASQPVPLGVIPSGREYQATPVKDAYQLTCHAGAVAIPG